MFCEFVLIFSTLSDAVNDCLNESICSETNYEENGNSKDASLNFSHIEPENNNGSFEALSPIFENNGKF